MTPPDKRDKAARRRLRERETMIEDLAPMLRTMVRFQVEKAIKEEKGASAPSEARGGFLGLFKGSSSTKRKANATRIDEVVLLTDTGLVVAHASRGESDLDPTIIGGMITAVQASVNDAFTTGGEIKAIDELTYRDARIMLESKGSLVMAVIVRGPPRASVRLRTQALLDSIWTEHQEVLKDWDGDKDSLTFLEPLLAGFVRLTFYA